MPAGRLIVHVVALTGLAAVAVAFGRWLRDPAVDSLGLVLALAATCALALRRLYGPEGIAAFPRAQSRERPGAPRAPGPGPPRPAPLWSSPATASPAPVDLNSAREDELRTLPGVGPVLAARIAAARPFASVGDLAAVPGFTPARVRAIADRVRV